MDSLSKFLPRLALVAGIAVASTTAAAEPAGSLVRESWSAVFLGGARIGHVRSTLVETGGETPILTFTTEMRMTMKRMSQEISIASLTRYDEEKESGQITGFATELDASLMKMARRGEIKDGVLRFYGPGAQEPEIRAWDTTLRGPMAIERELSAKEFEPGLEATFRTFSLDFMQPVNITFTLLGREAVDLWGERKELWKAEMTQDALPGMKTTVWLNDEAETLKTATLALGSEIVILAASREIALGEIEPAEVFLESAVMKLDRRIARPRQVSRAEYRMRFDSPESAALPLEGPRQEVLSRDGDEVVLRVSARPAPESAEVKEVLAPHKYLDPSSYIQSEDPAIRAAAEQAADGAQTPWEKAKRMEKWVFDIIEDKDLSVAFAGAVETLETRRGDCTEHSVLLAALLRAQGIPARLAFGAAYFLDPRTGEARMGGHVWTEAWIDGWHTLDASLAAPFVDAARIRLGGSALDSAGVSAEFIGLVNVLGSTHIDVLSVSHAQPE